MKEDKKEKKKKEQKGIESDHTYPISVQNQKVKVKCADPGFFFKSTKATY